MLISHIESLLFTSAKPLSLAQLVKLTSSTKKEVAEVLGTLKEKYSAKESGIALLETGTQVQLVSAPKNASLVRKLLKDDMTGELTRPSLETLTVIAYRGPITKAAIEEIRGVNCSLIIRNLLIRGLIEEEKGEEALQYRITTEFLRYLGVSQVSELPDYEELHSVQVDSSPPAGTAE